VKKTNNKKISGFDQTDLDYAADVIPMAYRSEIALLGNEKAKLVEKYIISTYKYLDAFPQKALEEAKKAVKVVSRLAVVREMLGLAAYKSGDWSLAIRELKTARRLNGLSDYLPIIADSYRGLGQPMQVFEIAISPEATSLPLPTHIEMSIVLAGAYSDIGKFGPALKTLKHEMARRGLSTELKLRLIEAQAVLLEVEGRQVEANKIWSITEPIRQSIDDAALSELIVYDIGEDESSGDE
jgi:tetratricopeptide (TPR) repeat protein